MKSEPFIAVYDWMLQDLGLNCREAMLYAVIYSFSNSAGSYTGGQTYLARRLKITRQTVNQTLRRLTEAGLILKRDMVRHGVRYCELKIDPAALARLAPEAPAEGGAEPIAGNRCPGTGDPFPENGKAAAPETGEPSDGVVLSM